MNSERDRDTAGRIAGQLRSGAASARGGKTWRKVTTLLADFGYARLTDDVRGRIAGALAESGVELDPPFAAVKRSDTVRLLLADRDRSGQPAEAWDPSDTIKVSVWAPGAPYRPTTLEGVAGAAGVKLFHIDPRAVPDSVFRALEPLCDGLTDALVGDLLTLDDYPKVTPLDPAERIRAVSSFQVVAREEDGDTGVGIGQFDQTDESTSGVLAFGVVEFACGGDWLLVCWHPWQETRDGHAIQPTDEPSDEEKAGAYRRVSARWPSRSLTSAGDLGVLLVHELAASYPLAYREPYAWLDQWEQQLDLAGDDEDVEIVTLGRLRGLAGAFAKRLHALNRPGMSGHRDLVWFPGVTKAGAVEAELADDLIDRGLRNLQDLGFRLRSALDLVSARRSLRDERHARRFQNSLTLLAGVLLVPTLIASIYGANTELPGRGRWVGFAILLGCMLASAALTYTGIRAWQARASGRDR